MVLRVVDLVGEECMGGCGWLSLVKQIPLNSLREREYTLYITYTNTAMYILYTTNTADRYCEVSTVLCGLT